MSNTIREYKGKEYPDKSRKDNGDRKSFVFRGDGWATKARGGVGNKRGWGGFSSWKNLPKWLYNKYKENINEKEK